MPSIRAMQTNPIAPLAKAVEVTLSKVTQIWNAKRSKLFYSEPKANVDKTSQHLSMLHQSASEFNQIQIANGNAKKRKLDIDENHPAHNLLMAENALPKPVDLSTSHNSSILCQYYVVTYFLSSCTQFDHISQGPEIIEMTVVLVNAKTQAIQNTFHAVCRPQHHPILSSVRLITSQISQVGQSIHY